ncbi:MAG: siphovirus ReqiPepy6 Gp37-like family protein [Eubacterium sp.]
MNLMIFDKNRKIIGDAEVFESLMWNELFYSCGNFSIYLSMTEKNINLFKKGNMVFIGDENIGIIETVIYELKENGQEHIEIGGRFSESFYRRRINWGRIKESNIEYEKLMRRLVEESCVNPINKARKIQGINMGTLKNYTEKSDYQNSFGEVLKTLEEIAGTAKMGFFNRFDPVTRELFFEVRKGTNRTDSQNENKRAIFSRKLNRIAEMTFTESLTEFSNCALIGGSGEDDKRKLTEIGNEKEGLERFEMFVDAREISDKDKDEKPMPEETYIGMLKQKGNEKLKENNEVLKLEGKYDLDGIMPEYIKSGDYVTVHDAKWGVKMDTQIIGIKTIYQKGKKVAKEVTFGNDAMTKIEKIIKRM